MGVTSDPKRLVRNLELRGREAAEAEAAAERERLLQVCFVIIASYASKPALKVLHPDD